MHVSLCERVGMSHSQVSVAGFMELRLRGCGGCQSLQACQVGEPWGLLGMAQLSVRWQRCLLSPAGMA